MNLIVNGKLIRNFINNNPQKLFNTIKTTKDFFFSNNMANYCRYIKFSQNKISNNKQTSTLYSNEKSQRVKNFCSIEKKSNFYIWFSNVNVGRRTDDYRNRFNIGHTPKKIEFFDDKTPVYAFCGPRHSAVITKSGQLYTFGSGNWGILGHGDEKSVDHNTPRLVEYFEKNNIKIKKICLGDFHSIALSTTGEVYTWGFGGDKGLLGFFRRDPGALGHGNWTHYFTPKRINYFNDNNIKIKDISSGVAHCICLSEDGKVYSFGRGAFGLLGHGSNTDRTVPEKIELLDILQKENSGNEIIKIDCADEYTGALTKGGDLYVWGKNNQGQLGIGSGIGMDMVESERFPTKVQKIEPSMKIIDFDCGENGMMIKSSNEVIYKTGWRIDYVMTEFKISRKITPRLFFCGNSYYCIIDKNSIIYQWGSLFKDKSAVQEDDMMKINLAKLFDQKNIQQISGKFKVCGAIVTDNN